VEIRIVNLQLDVEASKTAQNDIKKMGGNRSLAGYTQKNQMML